MKKLIIAAAIVCAAAFAQAASVNWELMAYDPVTGVDGTGTFTGSMTFACADLGWSETFSVTGGNVDYFTSFESELYKEYSFTLTATSGDYTYSQTGAGAADDSVGGLAVFDGGNAWTKKPGPEPEPTPEPTSAMLMLLGVAGLALKRKQK